MAMFSPSTRDTTHAWENGVAQVNPPQAPSQTPFRDFLVWLPCQLIVLSGIA